MFEVAAHGKPMILIPYPHATADHQTANARYIERAGAAVVISDGELTASRLAEAARDLLRDPGRLEAMSNAALAVARPSAATTWLARSSRDPLSRLRISEGVAGNPRPELPVGVPRLVQRAGRDRTRRPEGRRRSRWSCRGDGST